MEKDKFGRIVGETIESPGMVRWYSKPCHYFLKRIGNMATGIAKPDTFVLGLENQIGDGAYLFSTSIEFDNDEAPDLMDRIAGFNDLPAYTGLLKQVQDIRSLIASVEANTIPDGVSKGDPYFAGHADGFRAAIGAVKNILED